MPHAVTVGLYNRLQPGVTCIRRRFVPKNPFSELVSIGTDLRTGFLFTGDPVILFYGLDLKQSVEVFLCLEHGAPGSKELVRLRNCFLACAVLRAQRIILADKTSSLYCIPCLFGEIRNSFPVGILPLVQEFELLPKLTIHGLSSGFFLLICNEVGEVLPEDFITHSPF